MNNSDDRRDRRSGRRYLPLVPILALCLLWLPVYAVDLHHAPPLSPNIESGIHDPENEATKRLQNPLESMKGFPVDRRGEINWVRTLNEGLIEPRRTLTDDPWDNELMRVMDLDILMTNTQNMPHVLFPHKPHTQWLTCSNCHFGIFIPQKGANPISMTRILAGEFCGRCHDKVAFNIWTCERCHSVPHEGSGPKWW